MATNDFVKNTLREIKECLCEQKYFHESFANSADWINLRGEKRCHEYKIFCFMRELRKLDRFEINVLGVHTGDVNFEKINVVPSSFYGADREHSGDENTIRNFMKNSTEMWLKMEEENLDFYTKTWSSLIKEGTTESVALGCFVKCLLDATQKKVKYIRRCLMNYRATNYNILEIMGMQEKKHDHYREKMCKSSVID